MKKLLLTLPVIAVLISFTSRKSGSFCPPGTVKINDTLWYDKTEISNFAYREYVFWNKKTFGVNSEQYKISLPDTLVWRNTLSYNEPYVKYYFNHPAYKDYPVVGVSYEQAAAYCKWRTERVQELLALKNPGKKYEFEYRLPDKSEWQAMALLGWSKASEKSLKSGNGCKMSRWNFRYEPSEETSSAESLNNEADVTAPINGYYPNEKGIYNLYGNVAEMVGERGICVGGGWIHKPEQGGFRKTISYGKPESWLGFRCVCVVKNP